MFADVSWLVCFNAQSVLINTGLYGLANILFSTFCACYYIYYSTGATCERMLCLETLSICCTLAE